MRLIPVFNVNAVVKNWATFIEGFERVSDVSAGTENIQTIYNQLISGELLLWSAYMGEEYAGFCVSKVITDVDGTRHLLIHSLYGKDGEMDERWWRHGLGILEDEARKYGCSSVKFYTKRTRAMLKIMQPFGYDIERTLFSKEVV